MNKTYLLAIITGALMLQGCASAFQKHHGIDWGNPASCPAPKPSEIKNTRLVIEDGKTLKCQIRPYVSNMACQGITDKTNADGVVCQNGLGNTILFIFDDKGVLKSHGPV